MTALLVASAGGHLAQLHRLSRLVPELNTSRTWVTFDTPQSRSLLRDEDTVFIPVVGSRDFRGVARTAPLARRLLQRQAYDQVWSTGAAVALAFLPTAAAMGIPSSYIESAARTAGPSVTGRLLEQVPRIELYTQYPSLTTKRWSYRVSVFDEFAPVSMSDAPVHAVAVTVGSLAFPFERLIRRVEQIVPTKTSVTWQAGPVSVQARDHDLVNDYLPHAQLASALQAADSVLAHAGVGSALAALEAGRVPVLIPRRQQHGEHVDDHQTQIADELRRRGLALRAEADELRWGHVEAAAQLQVVKGAPVAGAAVHGFR